MKLNRQEFSNYFAIAASAVSARSPKEVFKNVLLQADGKNLHLIATDGEIHLRCQMDYAGLPEKTMLPAARMLAILRELDGEIIELTLKPGKVRVQCGSDDYDLAIGDPSEFPEVPTFRAEAYYKINNPLLKDAIRKTIFCVDKGNGRYATAGISIEITETATLISTDSKRLGVAECAREKVGDPSWPTTFPVVPAEAMRLVEKCDGEFCQISCEENSIAFKIGNVSIASQLIQGRFPNWKKVLPEQTQLKYRVDIPVNPFQTLLKKVRVMEVAEANGIELSFEKSLLRAKSKTTEIGNASAEIPIVHDGDPMKITFSGPFLAEMLKVLDPVSSVEVGLIHPDDKALFTSGSFRHVIMPQCSD